MKVRLVKPDLHELDNSAADVAAVGIFVEDRPPRGLAGLLDWRLCGRLSEAIMDGHIQASFREAVLMPSYGRLPVDKVCVFGLGSRKDFTPSRARETAWVISDALQKLRVRSFVTSLPGAPMTQIAPAIRMEVLLEEVGRVFGAENPPEVTVVEAAGWHRELNNVVGKVMRKMRAYWH